MSNKTSYPLCWPDGWPRSKVPSPSKFSYYGRQHSMSTATAALQRELDLLGVGMTAILSTNVRLRLDGLPVSNDSQPTDRGAAVYFKMKEREVVLACDKWNRVEDNVIAIAKHIEAMRGQERWGVGNLAQAFRGYAALPERAESTQWWGPLGLTINATPDQVKDAYRFLAKKYHPDNKETGNADEFRRIQSALEEFERQRREAHAA